MVKGLVFPKAVSSVHFLRRITGSSIKTVILSSITEPVNAAFADMDRCIVIVVPAKCAMVSSTCPASSKLGSPSTNSPNVPIHRLIFLSS